MGSLSSLDTVYIALVFIVPGFIIRAVRAQFIIEQDRTGVDQFVRLLTYSALNTAFFGSILYLLIPYSILFDYKFLVWSFLIAVTPFIVGVASGVASQKQLLFNLLCKLRLKPLHTVPNAWDYKFSQTDGEFVIVTLKDDVKIAGWWAGYSFASSDAKERDILIERIYKVEDEKQWEDTGKSLLICGGEVKRIEFRKPT